MKGIIAFVLVINALFWGLMDHMTHCKVAAYMGVVNCPPHAVHLFIGIVSYILAVLTVQSDYIFKRH